LCGKIFSPFDAFGRPFNLTFRGNTSYKTGFGALVTTACIIFWLVYLTAKVKTTSIQPFYAQTTTETINKKAVLLQGGKDSSLKFDFGALEEKYGVWEVSRHKGDSVNAFQTTYRYNFISCPEEGLPGLKCLQNSYSL